MKRILPVFIGLCLLTTVGFSQAVQKVLIEEFTGAWCGFCPDGALIVEDIIMNQQNAIAVAVHNGDAMELSAGTSINNFYNNLGFPSAIINRTDESIGRSNWDAEVTSQLNAGTSPVSVSFGTLSFDPNTRTLTVEPVYEVLSPLTGSFRINVLLTEDEVTGTGSGYNQVNYYNSTAGHPYQGAGDPIIGYEHNHTLRYSILSPFGGAGVVPNDAPVGTYSYTLTQAIHPDFDINKMHIIAFLAHFDGTGPTQRAIVNSEEIPFSTATSSDQPITEDVNFMEVYPNPMSDRSTVAFTLAQTGQVRVEVMNVMGQHVATLGEGIMTAGPHTLYWNGRNASAGAAANGVYLVRLVSENGQSLTTRLNLSR